MLRSIGQRKRPEGILRSIPAPVLGWNTTDAVANMDVRYALDMENWFCRPSDIMLRQGYSDQVTSVAGGATQVESLMAYSAPDGTEALYAAAGTAIYNCTQATASASVSASGFANARWEHTNFTNTAGTSFLLCVNGANGLRSFNGTAWQQQAISGATASAFVHITQFKERLWFCKDNSLQTYFLNTGAVSGTASVIDLSAFCRLGGEVMAITSWTFDAGDGIDDYWVAVTSNGELIVYQGTDPTAASTWAMVGRWQVARPLSRRCFTKFGGDVLYLAEDGVWPLSLLLRRATTEPTGALSYKIGDAIRRAASNYRTNFGWQVFFWPRETMVLANIPVREGSNQRQYVMNTITKAWSYFTGVAANCFEIYQGNIYFGGNGLVSRFWNTFADDGVPIIGEIKQAFHYFGSRARKQFVMARPILQTNGTPATFFGINTDFADNNVLSTLTYDITTYAIWDTSLWDTGLWGKDPVNHNWVNVSGLGLCGAPRLRVQSNGIETHWQSTDVLFKVGGVL